MEENTQKAEWNGVAIIAFLVGLAACIYFLNSHAVLAQIYFFNLLDVAILALATFRGAHLLTDDKILEPLRIWLLHKRRAGSTHGPWRTLDELIECLWCTGIWCALIMLTLYLAHPITRFIVMLFAVAGAGAIVQLLGRALAKVS